MSALSAPLCPFAWRTAFCLLTSLCFAILAHTLFAFHPYSSHSHSSLDGSLVFRVSFHPVLSPGGDEHRIRARHPVQHSSCSCACSQSRPRSPFSGSIRPQVRALQPSTRRGRPARTLPDPRIQRVVSRLPIHKSRRRVVVFPNVRTFPTAISPSSFPTVQ